MHRLALGDLECLPTEFFRKMETYYTPIAVREMELVRERHRELCLSHHTLKPQRGSEAVRRGRGGTSSSSSSSVAAEREVERAEVLRQPASHPQRPHVDPDDPALRESVVLTRHHEIPFVLVVVQHALFAR